MANNIIFYDGACGFCHKMVRFTLNHDTSKKFQFAPLQGSTAKQYVEVVDLEDLRSIVVKTSDERVLRQSEAVFYVLKLLPFPYSFVGALAAILPQFLTDIAYNAFASVRYKIFGRLDQCEIPSPDERARFLS